MTDSDQGRVLTLTLRRVPRQYTLDQLLEDIAPDVPHQSYDFVHLPLDARRESNITLAFVNFVDAAEARRAYVALRGRLWRLAPEAHPCNVVPTRTQGLRENLTHYVARLAYDRHSGSAPVLIRFGQAMASSTSQPALAEGEPSSSQRFSQPRTAAALAGGGGARPVEVEARELPGLGCPPGGRHARADFAEPPLAASVPLPERWRVWGPSAA